MNYEEEEYAEEEVMEPDKTASAAVQTRDNWCSLVSCKIYLARCKGAVNKIETNF